MYSLPPQRSGKRGRPREKGDRLPSLAELAVAPGDPDTPEVNSLVPSVNVVVTNSDGDVLLIRRSDNQNWAVPGGGIDLGESMVSAAVRETKEETGIEREVTGLVGIYTDPKHVIL